MWSRGLAVVMMIGCAGCFVRHDARVSAIASRDGSLAFASVERWRVERDPEWGWHEIDSDCDDTSGEEGGKSRCEMGDAFANLFLAPFALLMLPVPEHVHHVTTGHTHQLIDLDLRTGAQRVRATLPDDVRGGRLLGYDADHDVLWLAGGRGLLGVAGDGTLTSRIAGDGFLPGGQVWKHDQAGVHIWNPWNGQTLALGRRWRADAWTEALRWDATARSVAQCSIQAGADGPVLTTLRLELAALARATSDPTLAAERPWPVALTGCALSPDGRHLAGADAAGVVELWQVAPPTRLRVIEARDWRWHDARTLAIGGPSSRVAIDLATGVERELPMPRLPPRRERRPGWTTLTKQSPARRFVAVRYPDGVPELAVFDATTLPAVRLPAPVSGPAAP